MKTRQRRTPMTQSTTTQSYSPAPPTTAQASPAQATAAQTSTGQVPAPVAQSGATQIIATSLQAAAAAPDGLHVAGQPELVDDLHQMGFRDPVCLGDLLDSCEIFLVHRQIHEDTQAVVRVAGKLHDCGPPPTCPSEAVSFFAGGGLD